MIFYSAQHILYINPNQSNPGHFAVAEKQTNKQTPKQPITVVLQWEDMSLVESITARAQSSFFIGLYLLPLNT